MAVFFVLLAGTADVLYRTALRACLSKEDGCLGPWQTGSDTAEDELRAFAGTVYCSVVCRVLLGGMSVCRYVYCSVVSVVFASVKGSART